MRIPATVHGRRATFAVYRGCDHMSLALIAMMATGAANSHGVGITDEIIGDVSCPQADRDRTPWRWHEQLPIDKRPLSSKAAGDSLSYVPLQPFLVADVEAPDFTSTITRLLDVFGVAVVLGLLRAPLSDELADHLHHEAQTSTAKRGPVRKAGAARIDIPSSLSPADSPAVRAFMGVLEVLGDGYSSLLGDGAMLTDFAAMIPYPGAQAQGLHSDRPLSNNTYRFVTTFVYSKDVGLWDGALDVWPGSHRNQNSCTALKCPSPAIRIAPVPAGTAVIYDDRLRHRGSANERTVGEAPAVSKVRGGESGTGHAGARVSLYFGWKSEMGHDPDGESIAMEVKHGMRNTILPAYKRRITLASARTSGGVFDFRPRRIS